MHVVEVNQAIQQRTVAGHRTRLSSPRERQVRTEALRITRPKAPYLASLPVKIAAQLAGNIQHARAAAVIALVQHVVRRPEIVRTAFGNFVLRDFLRMLDVAHIHYVTDRAHRNAVAIVKMEDRGKYFVADEQIVLVAEHAMRSRQPSIAVKLVVI